MGSCLWWASPANAEIGTALSAATDLRFRGYSLSAGRPVGTFDFAYDDPSGFYASASAIAVAHHGIEPLGVQLSGGYAKRFESGTTLDLGIVHSNYSHYSSQGSGNSYTELYAGIGRKALSARMSFSPHYFNYRTWTVYGELDGSVSPARRLQLDGHVGLLVPVRTTAIAPNQHAEYDWSLGLSRQFGRASARAAFSGGGPGRDFYREYHRRRTALVLSLSYAL